MRSEKWDVGREKWEVRKITFQVGILRNFGKFRYNDRHV